MLSKEITKTECGITQDACTQKDFLSSNQTCLFNHDQIEKIYYFGLIDEEEEKFKADLNKMLDETQNQNKK